MEKVMVIGVSAGVGKSTFAKQLGAKTGIPVYHLDTLYWKPGWVKSTQEDFTYAQQRIVNKREWIIEGNYSSTYEIRAEEADTIIYLELPLRICLYRVMKRWLTNIGRNREDMGPGCPEKMDKEFLSFILKTYHKRKNNSEERLRYFNNLGKPKKVYRLKTKKAISQFLNKL